MAGWIRWSLCPAVHLVGWRLPSRRSSSFSSNVKFREMLSWNKPPRHRCSDNSCRCVSQPLLCHDSTSGSDGDKQVRVGTHRCTGWPGEQQQRLQWGTFTRRCLIRFCTLVLPMVTVTVLSLFLLPLCVLNPGSPDGTQTILIDGRCSLKKQCAGLMFSTFSLGACWWEMHLP